MQERLTSKLPISVGSTEN